MKEKTLKITDFLSLTVFTLFAVCLLLVLLTGAKVYRNLVDAGRESYDKRTAALYLTTRVRQWQTVAVEDFGGCDALVFREESGGRTYLTRIYCHDRWLRELYCPETADLSPEDGEPVLKLENLHFSLSEDTLRIELNDTSLFFALRSGKEAFP